MYDQSERAKKEVANKSQQSTHIINLEKSSSIHSSIVKSSVQTYYASSDCYAYWTGNLCFSAEEAGELDCCSAC